MARTFLTLSVSLSFALSLAATAAFGADTPMMKEVAPESVGFDPEKLKRLDQFLQGEVDAKQYAGMVIALTRHGKTVRFRAMGKQSLETGEPMAKDTIFYMGSQTKPVAGVAMMILYEQGKWRPDEPISKYIPEFANLKVFKEMKDGKMVLEDAQHEPTMGELMSMQAGFSYPIGAATNPIDKMYLEQGVLTSKTLQEMIGKIAKIPLLYQPGTRWVYSASADIQGYLIEKLSGMKLADFMEKELFAPLGMKDATFQVKKENLARLAEIYRIDPKTGIVATPFPEPKGISPNLASGGGGLFATTEDYLRMAQMLINGGSLNGKHVLSPSTVLLMRSNHLDEKILQNGKFGLKPLPGGMVLTDNMAVKDAFGIGFYRFQPGLGYGYNVAVFYDPVKIESVTGAGTFSWGGAFANWFWADPTNDLVFIGNIQRSDLMNVPHLIGITQTLALQALVDPKK